MNCGTCEWLVGRYCRLFNASLKDNVAPSDTEDLAKNCFGYFNPEEANETEER